MCKPVCIAVGFFCDSVSFALSGWPFRIRIFSFLTDEETLFTRFAASCTPLTEKSNQAMERTPDRGTLHS